MKKFILPLFFIPLALSSMACGLPSLNDQLFSYTRYSSSALFGNSAYAALQQGTGFALATQNSTMGSYHSFSAFTSLKNYTLQLSYGEMSNELNLQQNLGLALSRKFSFRNFTIATGFSLNGGKSTSSFTPLSRSERFTFQTGWQDFNSFSDQFITSNIGTAVSYKNLTALLSVNNLLLKSIESNPQARNLNAGLMYKHDLKSFKLTHGFNYNRQSHYSQLLGFSTGTYKFMEVGFGFKYKDAQVQGLLILGVELGKCQLSYAYSGPEATSLPATDIHTPLQVTHEASLAWNLHK